MTQVPRGMRLRRAAYRNSGRHRLGNGMKAKIVRSLITLAVLATVAAAPPPVLPPGLAAPAAHPVDDAADAHGQVDAAFAQVRPTQRLVLLDFGRFKKKIDTAQRFGIMAKAVPLVLVLTPGGTLLDSGEVTALSDARDMPRQSVAGELAKMAGRGCQMPAC